MENGRHNLIMIFREVVFVQGMSIVWCVFVRCVPKCELSIHVIRYESV